MQALGDNLGALAGAVQPLLSGLWRSEEARRFDALYAEDSHRPLGCTIRQLERRSVSVRRLRAALACARALCEEELWVSAAPGRSGEPLEPGRLTVRDVEHHLFRPCTKQRRLSFAEQMHHFPPSEPALWCVSYAGDCPMEELVDCVAQHAHDRRITEEAAVYWLWACASNPYDKFDLESYVTGARALRTLPFARALRTADGALSVLDGRGAALGRAWWAVELAIAVGPDADVDAARPLVSSRNVLTVDALATRRNSARKAAPSRLETSGRGRRRRGKHAAARERAEAEAAELAGRADMDTTLALLENPRALHDVYAPISEADWGMRAVGALDGLGPVDGGLEPIKAQRERRFPRTLAARALDFEWAAARAGDGGPAGKLDEKRELSRLVGDEGAVRALEATVRARVASVVLPRLLSAPLPEGAMARRMAEVGAEVDARRAEAGEDGGAEARVLGATPPGGGCAAAASRPPPPDKLLATAIAFELGRSRLRTVALGFERHTLLGPAPSTALGAARGGWLPGATLEELSITALALRGPALRELKRALGASAAPLAILRLTHCGLDPAHARSLGKGIGRASSLKLVDLRSNRIGDAGAGAVGGALRAHPAVEVLNLEDNDIGDGGAASLGAALASNSALIVLDLSCNRLGNSGAASLARALAAPASALEVLVLANNRIGDPGLEALSGSLNDSATLAELDLRGNRLLDEGVCALADALVANRTLTNLNLSDNGVGDEGAQALMDVMRRTGGQSVIASMVNMFGDPTKEPAPQLRRAGSRSSASLVRSESRTLTRSESRSAQQELRRTGSRSGAEGARRSHEVRRSQESRNGTESVGRSQESRMSSESAARAPLVSFKLTQPASEEAGGLPMEPAAGRPRGRRARTLVKLNLRYNSLTVGAQKALRTAWRSSGHLSGLSL